MVTARKRGSWVCLGGVLPNNSMQRSCSKAHVSLNQRPEVSQRFNLISSKIRVPVRGRQGRRREDLGVCFISEN